MLSKKTVVCLLVIFGVVFLSGCSKKADENKPISEVKSEAQEMSVEKLKSMAASYKDAIMAKEQEIQKLSAKIKDIPLTEVMGEEAKGLKSDVDALNKSISALKERFTIYYNELKEKGGDISGLEL